MRGAYKGVFAGPIDCLTFGCVASETPPPARRSMCTLESLMYAAICSRHVGSGYKGYCLLATWLVSFYLHGRGGRVADPGPMSLFRCCGLLGCSLAQGCIPAHITRSQTPQRAQHSGFHTYSHPFTLRSRRRPTLAYDGDVVVRHVWCV